MIGGQNEEIARAEQRKITSERGIEFLERASEAFHVLAMAVEHVKIDEIAEDQAVLAIRAQRRKVLRIPSALDLVVT